MLTVMMIITFTLIPHLQTITGLDAASLQDETPLPLAMTGKIYYVSKNGNNSDGRNWKQAWNELDQINWSNIRPGDVIYIDGGTEQMTYTTELRIGKSGLPGAPIVIQASPEAGRDGRIILHGGRNNPLPYCGQQSYENTPGELLRRNGIRTNNHDYIVIDGLDWQGIVIHGFRSSGIFINSGSRNIKVRNVEIYNNGGAVEDQNGWSSIDPGVRLGGKNILFKRAIVHDNGQDAFQSLFGVNNIQNFRLKQSWLYNGRRHPTVDESANYCTHTDGIQIFDGGVVSGVTLIQSVIGPGFTQGVILGQELNAKGSWAHVQNVKMRDVLFIKPADNGILGYRNTDTQNWNLVRVTVHCSNTKHHCIRIPNSNHSVRDSIFIDGLVSFPEGLNNKSGNCRWNTEGYEIGRNIDPGFTNLSGDSFALDSYVPNAGDQCTGSRITSVAQLLNLD